jgi:glycosyltransferase involved in cell wall biosynthesis
VKILFVDQYAQLGGAQHCLLDVVAAVTASGWQAQLCLPEPGPLEQSARKVGAEVFFEPFGSYSPTRKTLSEMPRYVGESLKLARALESRIRADRPALLYTNGPRPLPSAAWTARRTRLPIIFHCHNRLMQPSAIRLTRTALQINRTHLIACCRFAAEPLKSIVREDRFHLIYNGVRGPDSGEPQQRTTKRRRVGVVGRIAPEKGQVEFVDAACMVMAQLPDCSFVVCGDALFLTPTVQRYADEVGRRAKGLPVEFLGWRDDVYPLIASLDVLVVPSAREPATTRVILEAFACGVPVIAFDSGGIGEVLADGETGILVKQHDAAALARAIVTLLQAGDSELSRLGANGQQEWRNRYAVERFQRDVIQVIDQAVRTA